MAIDLSSITKKAALDMQTQAHSELASALLESSMEIDNWLLRASAYIQQNNIELKKEAKTAFDNYKSYMASKKMEYAAKEAVSNTIILEGYRILNEIGESIRGEKITYSITLTSTGHWGSATAPAGDVITWTMDYSAFSKLVKIGTKRLTVMDTFAASKQLEEMWINQTSDNMLAQLDGQKQNPVSLFQRKEWDISQINQYESFHSYAKRSRKDKGGKKIFYNRGQTLEAYFRWLAGQGPGIKYIRDKAMAETAANNLPFYAGGDLENVQIKGMNASVANIDTMITVLQETQAQLHLIIAESEKLSQDTSKVDVSKINSNIDTAIKSLLNKYGFK